MLSFGFLFAGLLAGFLIGWLVSRSSDSARQQASEKEHAGAQARMEAALQQREEMNQALSAERQKVVELTAKLSQTEADLRNMNVRLTEPVFSNDTLYIRETIRPCFTRQASWVKSDSKQDTLLMHEQGHFDLCELYGRRFRKSVQAMTLSLTGFDREINTLFQETWRAYQVEQDRYDRETEHGLITAVQLQWQALVADELEKLKEFASR